MTGHQSSSFTTRRLIARIGRRVFPFVDRMTKTLETPGKDTQVFCLFPVKCNAKFTVPWFPLWWRNQPTPQGQRIASRHQFRLLVDVKNESNALAHRPMLFHPDFSECEGTATTQPASDVKGEEMFSPTSPSPTRTMIKEANDHLQLLHHKVIELEKTVQEQAEALIKKDESMQVKMRETVDAKDAKIRELTASLEESNLRIKRLEQQCRDKDAQMEHLTHKYGVVNELNAFTPILERLVVSLKKLPRTANSQNSKSRHQRTTTAGTATTNSRGRSRQEGAVHIDGHHHHQHQQQPPQPPPTQAMADLRIGRSFSINQNFSMSEDEAEEEYS